MLLLWSSCDSLKMKKIGRPLPTSRGRLKFPSMNVIVGKGSSSSSALRHPLRQQQLNKKRRIALSLPCLVPVQLWQAVI